MNVFQDLTADFNRRGRPILRALTICILLSPSALLAQAFLLPTPNRTLLSGGGGEPYFVGTVGRPWTSGTFGCVRSGGAQLHEGIDIRCIHRDAKGESTDPVSATAAGKVAYINSKPSLSNYGNYIILQHHVHGLEVYSTYAHLREIRSGLKVGHNVKAGEVIGVMGRTTNTREQISKDRAHLHFELNFFINERFSLWHQKVYPGQRNDHRIWNGRNLIGIDPQKVLAASYRDPKGFNLLTWIRNQPEMCRVLVRDTTFPWLKRYSPLVKANPVAAREGIAGYEMVLTFTGLPFQVIPRAASEIKSKSKYQVLSVNEQEWRSNSCRGLVQKRGTWTLGNNGSSLLELLTY